jgi:hypothetical protein
MMGRCAGWLVVATGCGRLGIGGEARLLDAAIESDAAIADAVAIDAASPAPQHRYGLDGNFDDDHGGLALTPANGVGVFKPAGYEFIANRGLVLPGGMPVRVYTIAITLAFDELTGWRKVVDFKQGAIDEGLYAHDRLFSFVESANPEIDIEAADKDKLDSSVPFTAAITRDDNAMMVGYINGRMQWSLTDSAGVGTFTAQNGRAMFAVDDDIQGGAESSGGVLREIRIWDTALTAAQVGAL